MYCTTSWIWQVLVSIYENKVAVEGENGNSGDEETTSNAQPATPQQDSRDRSSPITEQIPPLDNSDTTVDNDTEPAETTKLLNEESD